jgi:hypothetical protein
MSPPPTSIDGTNITGATIDGQNVESITIDGQQVFSAAPDLPASVVANYDATRAISTGFISSITDQVGPHDLSGTASVISSGLNNKQTFRFDGTERMDTPTPNLGRVCVVALTFQIQGDPSAVLMIHGDDTNDNVFIHTGDGGSAYKSRVGTATTGNTGGTTDNDPHLAIHTFKSGGGATLEIDGTTIIDYNDGSANLDGFTLADRSSDDLPIEMDVGEVVLMDNPSTSDVNAERTRLSDKWGISV